MSNQIDQEDDMPSPTQRRHEELVALLTEIRDRLPERPAEDDPDEWKARYEALRGDVEEVVAYFEEHPAAGVRPRHVARRIKWNVLDRDDEWGQA